VKCVGVSLSFEPLHLGPKKERDQLTTFGAITNELGVFRDDNIVG